MKENRKLLKEVLKDIRHDMTDEEVLNLLADFCHNLIDKFNDCLVDVMCHVNCLNHLCFRNLIGTGFNHDNFLSCRSNCQL